MLAIEDTSCCGVKELSDINEHETPSELLETFCKDWFDTDKDDPGQGCLVTFTDIVSDKGTMGPELARFITRKRLGIIKKSATRTNPNSGNSIALWVWAVNKSALKKFWREHNPEDYKAHFSDYASY